MATKCIKLVIKNYYSDGQSLFVLGRIIKEDDKSFIFESGSGKTYQVSRSTEYILVETDIIFKKTT
jgi:hypothetical protein